MVSNWSLFESKSPQASRTLLSIRTGLNNAVVWMVTIRPPISNFPASFPSFGRSFQVLQITIGITATLMFDSFLSSLFVFSLSLIFSQWSARMAKISFFINYTHFALVFYIRLSD